MLTLRELVRLSKTRKKRPIPEGWATSDDVAALQTTASTTLPVPNASCLTLEGGYAVIGGPDGNAAVYSVEADKLERHVAVNAPITDALWTGSKLVFATAQGNVKIFEDGNEVTSFSDNAGAVTSLTVHPLGDLLAFVGVDKSIVFYNLDTLKRVGRRYCDAGECSISFFFSFSLYCIRVFYSTTDATSMVFELREL